MPKLMTVMLSDQQYKELVEVAPQDEKTPEGLLKWMIDEAFEERTHWQCGIPHNDNGVPYKWVNGEWV